MHCPLSLSILGRRSRSADVGLACERLLCTPGHLWSKWDLAAGDCILLRGGCAAVNPLGSSGSPSPCPLGRGCCRQRLLSPPFRSLPQGVRVPAGCQRAELRGSPPPTQPRGSALGSPAPALRALASLPKVNIPCGGRDRPGAGAVFALCRALLGSRGAEIRQQLLPARADPPWLCCQQLHPTRRPSCPGPAPPRCSATPQPPCPTAALGPHREQGWGPPETRHRSWHGTQPAPGEVGRVPRHPPCAADRPQEEGAQNFPLPLAWAASNQLG